MPTATTIHTPTPGATATSTLPATPPVLTPTSVPPTPTPEAPNAVVVRVHTVRPINSINNRVATIEIYGTNLSSLFNFQLGEFAITTTWIDATHVSARVPAGLPVGIYDLIVSQSGQAVTTLSNAFTVVDGQSVNDLIADPIFMWTNPSPPRAGENVQFGLIVQRLGGMAGLNAVQVRFDAQENGQTPILVGTSTVPAIGADDSVSSMGVEWRPPARGVYTLTATIDPDNQIAETDESNNQVRRTLIIQPPAQDTQPPQIDSFTVNQGASFTSDRTVKLLTAAHDVAGGVDSSSGLGHVMYVEMHWNIGAQTWVPVQLTAWLPYGEPHRWQLHPAPGMRYLQAWVADLAGNTSASSAKSLINFAPDTDFLLAGETRILRIYVQQGHCLRITTSPIGGDSDVYIWPPTYQPGQPYWHSINGFEATDSVEITVPETGQYQVEIDGVTTVEFVLEVRIAESCVSHQLGLASEALAKTPRTSPLINTMSEPPGIVVVPPAQFVIESKVYLPWVVRSSKGN